MTAPAPYARPGRRGRDAGSVRLDALVSPHVGVVRTVDERLVGPADARMPTYTAELAADDRLLGASLSHVGVAAGMAPDHRSAVDAALGEAAERYSLSFVPHERLVHATAAELGAAALVPERLALFSESQYARPGFPFVRFTSATRVPWAQGALLPPGSPAWVPAELVFLADPVPPGGRRIAYATSSGAACATTEQEATLRGLLELCERDAFAVTWAARLSLPLLDWSRQPRLVELERRYFAPTGLRYAAVDLSAFHRLPSVLGVVRAPRSETAALGIGAGTAATVEGAWWKALSEAFGTRAAARALAADARELHDDGRDVRTFDDHIAYHAAPERGVRSLFLDASDVRVDVRSVEPLPASTPAQLDAVLERLAEAGATAYAVDVTSPDLRELGLRVVKTVAPELCMLDVPHSARFLGSPRLRTLPCRLGYRAAPLAEHDLNPDPHPFP